MELIAVALALVSAFLHALRNLLVKRAIDKQVFALLGLLVGLTLYLPAAAYVTISAEVDVAAILLYGLLSGFIHFFYVIFYTGSYEGGDFSQVYPIMRSAPALVLVVAILFLGEYVSFRGGLGIALVVLGAYSINLKGIGPSAFIEPIAAHWKERHLQLAVLTMLTVAAYSIVDKLAVALIHPVLFLWSYTLVTVLMLGGYLALTRDRGAIEKEWRENRRSVLLNGVFGLTSYVLILYAFQLERVSYIAGLRQISVVMAVIMGGQLLGEGFQGIRLAASILIFAGAMLIATAQ